VLAYKLVRLLHAFNKNTDLTRPGIYYNLIWVCSKSEFEKIFQFIKQLSIMRDIARHKITNDEQLNDCNFCYKSISKFRNSKLFDVFVSPPRKFGIPIAIFIDYKTISSLFTDMSSK
jgi:hypothetical protein